MSWDLRDVFIDHYRATREGQRFAVGREVTLGLEMDADPSIPVPDGGHGLFLDRAEGPGGVACYRATGVVIPVAEPLFEAVWLLDVGGMYIVVNGACPGGEVTVSGPLNVVDGYVVDSFDEQSQSLVQWGWRITGSTPVAAPKRSTGRSPAGYLLKLAGPV